MKKSTASVALGLTHQLITYLRSDEGKKQLAKAPELIRWARRLAGNRPKYPDAIDTTARRADDPVARVGATAALPGGAASAPAPLSRRVGRAAARAQALNPVERIGHRGLERRLAAVRTGLQRAFPDDEARPPSFAALDELDRALSVAATLPTVKRLRLHQRIDRQLDDLESALLAAALPTRR